MRINNVGPQVVAAPEVRSSVGQVRAAQPVNADAAAAYSGGRIIVEPIEGRPAPTTTIEERRRAPRRADDRRRQQLAVLIDTRVTQRRTARRRADDAPPDAVDTQA